MPSSVSLVSLAALIAGTLVTGVLIAAPVAAERRPAPLELIEPRAGIELVAGESMAVAWRLRPGARADFEEWEAFLSLDGGSTWPYRLTPHLDREIERFVVDLPPVASPDARLMLRYGDERDERELVAPFALRIAPPRSLIAVRPARRAARPGEAARAGGTGVVAWTDGSRSGDQLVRYDAGAASKLHSAPELRAAPEAGIAFVDPEPEPPQPPSEAAHERRAGEGSIAFASSRSAIGSLLPPTCAERLARLGRRNE